MTKTPKTVTVVTHVVQCSFAYGIEWEPWYDMPDSDHNEDVYDAIGKAELFHYFMEYGAFPASHADTTKDVEPIAQAIHKAVLHTQKTDKHKFRTRIVRRTIVSTITDEEVDKAMVVKYGSQK